MIVTPRDCTYHGTFSTNPACWNNRDNNYYDVSVNLVCTDSGSDGGDGFTDFGDTVDNSSQGGGSNSGGGSTSPIIPCEDSVHGCGKNADIIARKIGLSFNERDWLRDQSETTILFYKNYLYANSTIEAKNWAKGQIELEILTQNIPWKTSTGTIAGLEYTHSHFDGSRGFFKLKDGSIVVNSSSEQTLTTSGDLRDKYNDFNPNDRFIYIKLAGSTEWAEMLFNPDNFADGLSNLFKLAAKDLGKNLGRYVLPIEDIKILIDGKDFDGQQVARWKAAGFLLFAVIPGSKAVKVVGNVADATSVAVKLGGKTLVVDTIKTGLKVITNNNVVKFLSETGDEVAKIVDGIMTFNYTGFGGKIITNPNKTTTLIGKWGNQLENIWKTGLAKQGANEGGMNILGEATGTLAEKWTKNKQWLNQAIARGDIIRVTVNPIKASNIIFKNTNQINFNSYNDVILYMKSFNEISEKFNNLGYFGKEIYTLINRDYIYDPILKIFKP